MNLPNVKAMFQDASRGLGGKLTCTTCGKTQACSEREPAAGIARGAKAAAG